MKIKKSILTLALVLAVLCGITIGASAAGTAREIKALLNPGIAVTYNGVTQTFSDAKGNRVYPVSYNGSTYLPVRAVANMLGIDVAWDSAAQTVVLNDKNAATGTDLIETFQPYSATSEARQSWNTDITRYFQQVQKSAGKTETIGGVTADHWALMHTGKYCEKRTVSGYYNLGGKYDTLTFQVYSNRDVTLSVYGDDEVQLAEYTVTGSQTPQTYTVNLVGTTQLHFQMDVNSDAKAAVSTYIFNANLK